MCIYKGCAQNDGCGICSLGVKAWMPALSYVDSNPGSAAYYPRWPTSIFKMGPAVLASVDCHAVKVHHSAEVKHSWQSLAQGKQFPGLSRI